MNKYTGHRVIVVDRPHGKLHYINNTNVFIIPVNSRQANLFLSKTIIHDDIWWAIKTDVRDQEKKLTINFNIYIR